MLEVLCMGTAVIVPKNGCKISPPTNQNEPAANKTLMNNRTEEIISKWPCKLEYHFGQNRMLEWGVIVTPFG